jgi:hypothetical protein
VRGTGTPEALVFLGEANVGTNWGQTQVDKFGNWSLILQAATTPGQEYGISAKQGLIGGQWSAWSENVVFKVSAAPAALSPPVISSPTHGASPQPRPEVRGTGTPEALVFLGEANVGTNWGQTQVDKFGNWSLILQAATTPGQEYGISAKQGLIGGQWSAWSENVLFKVSAAPVITQPEPSTVITPLSPPIYAELKDDVLPDMTGFELDSLGGTTTGWFSPSYLLACRDLQPGETLNAWLINIADGKPLEQIAFTADASNQERSMWPQAFAQTINRDGKYLKAGGWTPSGEFTALVRSISPGEFAALDLRGKAEVNRLWHYSSNYRAFTSAAFNNNWVRTQALSGNERNKDDVLWVQVRDITSQYLYETHVYSSTQDPADKTWLTSLCKQINLFSKMARAGRLDMNTGLIEPGIQDNALWVPQCSELAVTVQSVNWRIQSTVTASHDLQEDESIHCFVMDEFSNAQLVAPHRFTPTQRSKSAWIAEWALALRLSPLNNYLQVSGSTTSPFIAPGQTTQATLWQAGAPVRVFTTEPSLENWLKVTAPLGNLYQNNQTSVSIQLLNGLTQSPMQEIVFSPGGTVRDKDSWTSELCQYLFSQLDSDARQYLRFGTDGPLSPATDLRNITGDVALWVPRFSGIEVAVFHTPGNSLKAESKQDGSVRSLRDIEFDLVSKTTIRNRLLVATAFFMSVISHVRGANAGAAKAVLAKWIGEYSSLKKDGDVLFEGVLKSIVEAGKGRKDFASDLLYNEDFSRSTFGIASGLFRSSIIVEAKIESLFLKLYQHESVRSFICKHASLLDDVLEYIFNAYKNYQEFDGIEYEMASDLIEVLLNGTGFLELTDFSDLRARAQLVMIFSSQETTIYNLSEIALLEARSDLVIVGFNAGRIERSTTLAFRLSPEAIMDGVCFLSFSRPHNTEPSYRGGYVLDLHIPTTLDTSRSQGFIHAGYVDAQGIWTKVQSVPISSFRRDEGKTPDSHLCADYGNTYRSEVFDVSGQTNTGVDPRTGLFNAYYPLASLMGLEGRGPVCDLGMHYSPTRANEAGLGDGWAFNFSSYDNRARTLTLSSGQSTQLTDGEIIQLKNGVKLKKPGYRISAQFKNDVIHSLTLDFVSGRRETLSVPKINDNLEPFAETVKTVIEKLNEVKRQFEISKQEGKAAFDQSVGATITDIFTLGLVKYNDKAGRAALNQSRQEWRKTWEANYQAVIVPTNQELAFWQRPDVQLLPTEIAASTGGGLNFTWERRAGQFLLKSVLSGEQKLMTGDYQSVSDTSSKVTLDIWPDTDEAYRVELELSNYLLKKLTRTEFRGQDRVVLQQVHYGYAPDPTLDRVLTDVWESDGSREAVVYKCEAMKFPGDSKPALPRVIRHMVQPGAGQASLCTTWRYSENNYLGLNTAQSYSRFSDSAVVAGEPYRYSSTAEQEGATTLTRTWNGLHLQVREEESEVSGTRKTTEWTFTAVAPGHPRFGLPTNIRTISRDADLPPLKESAL